MYCIADDRIDPYFNLAAEEYLLKQTKEEYFMLWRNEPSIVVGKHQNALAELDLIYAREKGLNVARRISGGGTVFHDLGNLNFSFISNGEEGKLINYRRFATPIVEVLGKLGIEAGFSKRDDILIDGMKISGNASHVYKTRALHHGTLLFSSDLSDLSKALKTNPERYKDKAVKSVRSKVTNISQHLSSDLDVLEFRDRIMSHILASWKESKRYSYSKKDFDEITRLKEERFSTWEWNYGYSPKYKFSKKIKIQQGIIGVEMNITSGIIDELFIECDFLRRTEIASLEQLLLKCRHDPEYIGKQLDLEVDRLKEMGLSKEQIQSVFL